MTGRRRPAAASARAVRVSAARSSGLAAPPARMVTCLAWASSAVTGAKLAAGHAEWAEPAAGGEQPERRPPDVPAHAVEHHVHLAGGVADLLFPAVMAVVDGQVGPEITRDRELARLAGQRHDPGPGVAGDLHQQRPHASGRGLDQDGIARAQGRPARQGERRPAVGQQGHRVPQGHPVRDLDQPGGRHDHAFGVSARAVQAGYDLAPGSSASEPTPATVPPTPLPRMAGSAGSIDG